MLPLKVVISAPCCRLFRLACFASTWLWGCPAGGTPGGIAAAGCSGGLVATAATVAPVAGLPSSTLTAVMAGTGPHCRVKA